MEANKIIIVVGRRNTGKTTLVKNKIIIPSPLPKKLILDTFDNPVWHSMATFDHPERENQQIPIIPQSYLHNWNQGTYRCVASDMDSLFETVEKTARNTLIVHDDATKIIKKGAAPEKVMKYLWDSKQKNLNIVLCFHALMAVPTDVIWAADYVVLLKTSDYEVPSKWKAVENIETYFKHVRNSKDPFTNVTIQIQ